MASKGLIVLLCVVAAVLADEAGDKYTAKYDNIDLDEILHTDRLLNGYVNCVLDKGPCTPEGKELKDHIQEAIENGCAKCTEKQEKGATVVIEFLIENKKEIWDELCKKFDPEGKWRKKYEERARAKGINIA